MIGPRDGKVLDANSEALGVSIDILMDNAGMALAKVITEHFKGKKVLIVCGIGNNGGDGFAAAYYLKKEFNVTVAMLEDPDNIKTMASRNRLEILKMKPKRFSDVFLGDFDVLIDCVLGMGVKGTPKPAIAKFIQDLELFKGTVISADVPTGFLTDVAVKPDITVTFHDLKEGMDEANSGKIIVADIGIPEGAWNNVGPGDMLRYPLPDNDSHKGQNGRLLVIGGGPYIGAPALSAMAALRVGVDIVKIATPKRSFVQISSMCPSFITYELSGDVLNVDDVPFLLEMTETVDAVLIGPGIGRSDETMEAVTKFTEHCSKPLVVDADAVACVPASTFIFRVPIIFTPHHRELEEMLAGNTPEGYVRARGNDVVFVIKGKVDVITDGVQERENHSGCAAMTVGGTGDVLSGAVAGLLAKGSSIFEAGCLGAYICGKAGEEAFKEYSYGLTAPDVIECIAKVLRTHLK